MVAAVEEDGERPVGERFGNASVKMQAAQPKTAAREFEELAKHFRFIEKREESREKLEELASSLRDAGSEISGSELQKMEEIAEEGREGKAGPKGLQAIESGSLPEDLQKLLAPQMGKSGEGGNQPVPMPGGKAGETGEGQKAPVPGLAKGEATPAGDDSGKPDQLQAPVPGESREGAGAGQGMGLSDQARDGKGEGGILSAPVPGSSPGQSTPGSGMNLAGGSSGQKGQGGDQAGSGTAELFDDETDPVKAARDAEVIAQINEDGASTVRAVEGKARSENATRTRREVVTDFLAAEEQALDGKSLPMSRRQHVIRYFSAIRSQFENDDSTGK
jgi:hypothetical protein